MFSDTAAEAGILSFRKFATPPVDVSENKYFPALYKGFAGGGKRKGIGYRERCNVWVCRNGRLQDLVRVCYSRGMN